jgi:hypothetical protein
VPAVVRSFTESFALPTAASRNGSNNAGRRSQEIGRCSPISDAACMLVRLLELIQSWCQLLLPLANPGLGGMLQRRLWLLAQDKLTHNWRVARLASAALLGGEHLGQRLRRSHDHVVRDDLRLAEEGAERQAGEDVPAGVTLCSSLARRENARLRYVQSLEALRSLMHLTCSNELHREQQLYSKFVDDSRCRRRAGSAHVVGLSGGYQLPVVLDVWLRAAARKDGAPARVRLQTTCSCQA